MKFKIISIVFVLFSYQAQTQTSSWKQICVLDQTMSHSSGLLTLNHGETFWTQVDNGSPAEIFEFDKNGIILRTLKIENVSKMDWEDITHDGKGTIFIGDFGNNNNNRKDLKIYILKNVDQHLAATISAETIVFSYADQKDFPPAAPYRNYDMEAMVWFQDSLHLFSKNRTDPFSGYTYQYAIPAKSGSYNVNPMDRFKTGDGPMLFFWITAAAMDLEKNNLILLSHDRIWKFSDFNGSQFFQGKSNMIQLPSYTQKEAICYAKDNTWYITDEYNSTIRLGGNLYEMKLETVANENLVEDFEFVVSPNPAQQLLDIIIPNVSENNNEKIKLYDAMGKLIMSLAINKIRTTLPLQNLANGIYFINRSSKFIKNCKTKKLIIQK
ncbi:MAG: T9SS type A sorting domain-containing protein [Saprospiraceae bacterium]